nr:proline-rich receptor-like protein kinase PERK1 [Aegilops tauschii subsp. strangulata]
MAPEASPGSSRWSPSSGCSRPSPSSLRRRSSSAPQRQQQKRPSAPPPRDPQLQRTSPPATSSPRPVSPPFSSTRCPAGPLLQPESLSSRACLLLLICLTTGAPSPEHPWRGPPEPSRAVPVNPSATSTFRPPRRAPASSTS